ncbi:MAG: GPW/gp25 family protein [Oscillospiraceae bacterium]|nr:GPW/gp25 family protein [Oscillospiraceae bacterium]
MTYTVNAADVPIQLGLPDGVKSILQGVALILRTRRGTVPMYRDYGLPMDYVGMPTTAAKPVLYAAVREAVEEYEPRCRVVEVSFSTDSSGQLIPSVEVEIANE